MNRELSDFEIALTHLVHFLASEGLTMRDVEKFLDSKTKGVKVLDRLEKEGLEFVNELKTFVNQSK